MKTSVKHSPKRRVDDNLVISDVLSKPDAAFDLVVAELHGDHPSVINKVSDRAYFVLSGRGKVLVGNETYNVEEQDLVFIPRNTVHSIRGHLKYMIITSPPFHPSNEEILEQN
jgi:mannose-6-phosphate isomerase-like protein (cupin superfamily)